MGKFSQKVIFTIRFDQFLFVIIHKYLYCTLAILYQFTLNLFLLQK